MEHIAYCESKAKELDNLLAGNKNMLIRGGHRQKTAPRKGRPWGSCLSTGERRLWNHQSQRNRIRCLSLRSPHPRGIRKSDRKPHGPAQTDGGPEEEMVGQALLMSGGPGKHH